MRDRPRRSRDHPLALPLAVPFNFPWPRRVKPNRTNTTADEEGHPLSSAHQKMPMAIIACDLAWGATTRPCHRGIVKWPPAALSVTAANPIGHG